MQHINWVTPLVQGFLEPELRELLPKYEFSTTDQLLNLPICKRLINHPQFKTIVISGKILVAFFRNDSTPYYFATIKTQVGLTLEQIT